MLKYELAGLHELRQRFDPRLVNKAYDHAIQVATTKAKTRVSKKVREIYNIKASAIAKKVKLKKIPSEPGRLLVYVDHMIGLDKFGARPKTVKTARGRRVGVTTQVKRAGGRKLVKGGFLGQAANAGNPFIFTRKRGTRMLTKKKEQLRRRYAPSIAHLVANPRVAAYFEAGAAEDAAKEFNRYLEYLMTSRPTA